GRSDIYLHALTNLGGARCSVDVESGGRELLEAIAEARRRDEPDLVPRLYCNLVYMMAHDRRHQRLFDYIDEGIGAAVARDNAPPEAYLRGCRALVLLNLGRTSEALTEAEFVLHGPYPRGIGRFTVDIALARARIRMGVGEEGVLDEARALPTAQRDIM